MIRHVLAKLVGKLGDVVYYVGYRLAQLEFWLEPPRPTTGAELKAFFTEYANYPPTPEEDHAMHVEAHQALLKK
jgi:hypothetical protein